MITTIIIIIVSANRRRKVQQRRSSTRSNWKLTMAPLAAAIGPCVTLEHSLQRAGISCMLVFWWGRKTREPGEKPSKQRRKPTQTQAAYGVGSGNRTRATMVGGECPHHYAISRRTTTYFKVRLSTERLWKRGLEVGDLFHGNKIITRVFLPVKFQIPFNGPVTDVLNLMFRESTSCPNMWYQKRR